MRQDGKIERWNEILPAREVVADIEHTTPHVNSPSVDDFAEMVEESLKYYQGYHICHNSDPWTIALPFAWEVRKGMKLINETTREEYTVNGLYKDAEGLPTGWINIEGNVPPKKSDRLYPHKDYRLRFWHGYPKSLQPYFLVDESDTLGDHTGAWFDTITWTVTVSEPASVQGAPMSGPRQRKPRTQNYVYNLDESYSIEIRGHPMESIVNFDLWTQTQEAASRLVAWFTAFMALNTRVFKYNGVRELLFWERKADNVAAQFRKDIVSRTLGWLVRTEDIYTSAHRLINNLKVYVSLADTPTPDALGVLDPTGVPVIEVTES